MRVVCAWQKYENGESARLRLVRRGEMCVGGISWCGVEEDKVQNEEKTFTQYQVYFIIGVGWHSRNRFLGWLRSFSHICTYLPLSEWYLHLYLKVVGTKNNLYFWGEKKFFLSHQNLGNHFECIFGKSRSQAFDFPSRSVRMFFLPSSRTTYFQIKKLFW